MAPLLVFIQVLQDMVPPKKHLLRHQPANAQIGLMEGNTFCTTLQPRLFTMDLNVVEHKVFYTEVWCERVRLMADCQPVLERRQLSEKAWAAAEMPSCSLAQHLQRWVAPGIQGDLVPRGISPVLPCSGLASTAYIPT